MKGEKLQEIRRSFGLTQVEFADKLGVHAITLSRFERNVDPISRVVELAVCELERRLQVKADKKRMKTGPKVVEKPAA